MALVANKPFAIPGGGRRITRGVVLTEPEARIVDAIPHLRARCSRNAEPHAIDVATIGASHVAHELVNAPAIAATIEPAVETIVHTTVETLEISATSPGEIAADVAAPPAPSEPEPASPSDDAGTGRRSRPRT